MDRLKFLVLLLLSVAAVAQEGWLCKKDIAYIADQPPPIAVSLDKQGRIYLLYTDGFLDIYDQDGKLIQHRGGKAEEAHTPQQVTPQSLWVGRMAATAMLCNDDAHQTTNIVLVPEKDGMKTLLLAKARQPLQGKAAMARDLDGQVYVWNGTSIRVFSPKGELKRTVQLPSDMPVRRPTQLAVDTQGGFYCLDTAGLHVFTAKGLARYEVAQAQCMYLTGADRLAVVGPDFLRRYSPKGALEVDLREPNFLKTKTPAAVSINDKGQFFVFLREGGDTILKLDTKGEQMQEFPQPTRVPPAPDPGFRLDYEGRLHYWDSSQKKLMSVHPGGKVESALSYSPDGDPQGRMLNPSEVAVDAEGTAWISDSGNNRLQRFNLNRGGWQPSINVGVQGGPARATPRGLAITPGGTVLVVVHTPQQVVLQTRNLKGELLNQRPLGDNRGEPVVKVAATPNGEIYIYRSLSGVVGVDSNPSIERFDSRGNKVASLGPDGRLLRFPGDNTSRLELKPQENLVPYRDGVLLATGGKFYKIAPNLSVSELARLNHAKQAPGRRNAPDFGGAAIADGVLYVTDIDNHCLHRIPLPK